MAVNHIKEWAREVLSTTSITFTFGNCKIEKKPIYSFNSYSAPAILTTSSSPPSANDTDTDDETPKASQENDCLQHFVTAEETSGLTPPRPKPSAIPRLGIQHFRGRRQRSCGPGELEKGHKGKATKMQQWTSEGSDYGTFD